LRKPTLKYQRSLIVFIDILGFKEIVKQSEVDSSKIELLFSVLQYLKDWEKPDKWNLDLIGIEEDAQKKGVHNFEIIGKTNSTSFSDSIVVTVKVDDNANEMTSTLIANLSYIGALLMEKGILLRGGMTIGNIIHTGNGTVFGQGLIDAYQLESKSAKYPRIILSDVLVRELNYPLETKKKRYPYHQYIDRFEDGCVGFHQMIYYQVMDSWVDMTLTQMKFSLNNIRKVIIDGLDASFENPDVFYKYKWLMNQYNKLIILSDFDNKTRSEENVKIKMRNINCADSEHNIHYSYIDSIYSQHLKLDEDK
jgi:hypothetical protein